jgi:hypothetical protein
MRLSRSVFTFLDFREHRSTVAWKYLLVQLNQLRFFLGSFNGNRKMGSTIAVLSRRPGPAIRTVKLAGGLCVSNVDAHHILCLMGSEETAVD